MLPGAVNPYAAMQMAWWQAMTNLMPQMFMGFGGYPPYGPMPGADPTGGMPGMPGGMPPGMPPFSNPAEYAACMQRMLAAAASHGPWGNPASFMAMAAAAAASAGGGGGGGPGSHMDVSIPGVGESGSATAAPRQRLAALEPPQDACIAPRALPFESHVAAHRLVCDTMHLCLLPAAACAQDRDVMGGGLRGGDRRRGGGPDRMGGRRCEDPCSLLRPNRLLEQFKETKDSSHWAMRVGGGPAVGLSGATHVHMVQASAT
jgi:hypothetical protein